eukprot:1196086-Prorocentrum_minimum.AAC.6
MFALSSHAAPAAPGTASPKTNSARSALGSNGSGRIASSNSSREFQPSSSSPLNPNAPRRISIPENDIVKSSNEKTGLASRFKNLFSRKGASSRPGSGGRGKAAEQPAGSLPEIVRRRSNSKIKSSSFCVSDQGQRVNALDGPSNDSPFSR